MSDTPLPRIDHDLAEHDDAYSPGKRALTDRARSGGGAISPGKRTLSSQLVSPRGRGRPEPEQLAPSAPSRESHDELLLIAHDQPRAVQHEKPGRAAIAVSTVPAEVDFGTVEVGHRSRPVWVSIVNDGRQAVTIDSVYDLVNMVPPELEIRELRRGTRLAPDNHTAFQLTFAPMTTGSYDAHLLVNDAAGPLGGLQVKGEGAPKSTVLPVELVNIGPQLDMGIAQLGRHAIDLIDSILLNYQTALELFRNHATLASEEEAKMASLGVLAVKPVRRMLFGQLTKYTSSVAPGSSHLQAFLNLPYDLGTALAEERARAKGARESNTLKKFLVAQIKSIGDMRSKVRGTRELEVLRLAKRYEALPVEKREDFRTSYAVNVRKQAGLAHGRLSSSSLFTSIVARWVNAANKKEHRSGEIVLEYHTPSFVLVSAKLTAPLGERLAEGLRTQGPVSIADIPVTRRIYWYLTPFEDPLVAVVFPFNRASIVTNPHGDTAARQFVEHLKRTGLPKTSELTGSKAKMK